MKAFVYNRHDNKRLAEISHVTTVHEKNGLLGIATADGRQYVYALSQITLRVFNDTKKK